MAHCGSRSRAPVLENVSTVALWHKHDDVNSVARFLATGGGRQRQYFMSLAQNEPSCDLCRTLMPAAELLPRRSSGAAATLAPAWSSCPR